MRSKQCRLLLFLLVLVSAGCRSIAVGDDDPHGLTLVSLKLTSENYGLLNSQLFTKRPADARIRIKGAIEVDCQIAYAGRSSLDDYRRSYDLFFCDKEWKNRSSYRLSAQSIDRSMIRALIGYEAFRRMGLDAPQAESASAYVNRRYIGLYTLMETVDAEFFKARKRSVRDIYKARYGNAGFKREFASKLGEAFTYEGKPDNFSILAGLYAVVWDTPDDAVFAQEIEKILDVNSFLAYMATALSIAHWDGFDNNYFLVLDRSQNKLVTVPWDLDRIWEKTETQTPESLMARNELLTRMLRIPSFRQIFANKLTSLQELYPLDAMITDAQALQAKTAAAYKKDPVLSTVGSQEQVMTELLEKMRAWDLKVREYQAGALNLF